MQYYLDTIALGYNCVGIQVVSRKLKHLAPCLVEDREVAVKDVEEPADDVLVRAVASYNNNNNNNNNNDNNDNNNDDVLVRAVPSFHKIVAVMDILEPGHRHCRVVTDQLEEWRTKPHEHVVHLTQSETLIRFVKNFC